MAWGLHGRVKVSNSMRLDYEESTSKLDAIKVRRHAALLINPSKKGSEERQEVRLQSRMERQ